MHNACRQLIFLALPAFLLLAGHTAAQDSPDTGTQQAISEDREEFPPMRVGFVDMELVLDESRAIRSIVGRVDEELELENREIEALEREVRRIRLSIEQQDAVLSDGERAERQRRAVELLNEIEDREYRLQRRFREQQRTTIGPLLERIVGIVGDVAAREEFDLVVRGEMVLYGRETADLTFKVIDELDEREEELRSAVGQANDEAGVEPAEDELRPIQPLPLIP